MTENGFRVIYALGRALLAAFEHVWYLVKPELDGPVCLQVVAGPCNHTKTVVIRGPTTNFRLTTEWLLASPAAQSQ
jgi:hypothetical protein